MAAHFRHRPSGDFYHIPENSTSSGGLFSSDSNDRSTEEYPPYFPTSTGDGTTGSSTDGATSSTNTMRPSISVSNSIAPLSSTSSIVSSSTSASNNSVSVGVIIGVTLGTGCLLFLLILIVFLLARRRRNGISSLTSIDDLPPPSMSQSKPRRPIRYGSRQTLIEPYIIPSAAFSSDTHTIPSMPSKATLRSLNTKLYPQSNSRRASTITSVGTSLEPPSSSTSDVATVFGLTSFGSTDIEVPPSLSASELGYYENPSQFTLVLDSTRSEHYEEDPFWDSTTPRAGSQKG